MRRISVLTFPPHKNKFVSKANTDREQKEKRLSANVFFLFCEQNKAVSEANTTFFSDRREQLFLLFLLGLWFSALSFFFFRLSFPVRFSIHNFYYLEKSAFSERSVAGARKGRLFKIMA